MPLRAAGNRLPLIEHFAVNLVRKHVKSRARASGQLIFAGTRHKVKVANHGVASLLHLCGIATHRRGHGPGWERNVEQAARFKQFFHVGPKALNLELHHLGKFAGDFGSEIVER